MARGHPIDTQVDFLAVCGAPLHSYTPRSYRRVLRRSPALVTSSSPSPRRHADGTLPRPQLDQEYEGRHRIERVLNTEVRTFGAEIGRIMKTYDYIDRVDITLPLSVYEGTWTHSPSSFLCITQIDLA